MKSATQKRQHLTAAACTLLLNSILLSQSGFAESTANPQSAEKAQAAGAKSDTKTLTKVTVTAPYDNADSVAKTDVPLRELPASIQIVPQEVLRERGVTRTNQLLENVSGVQAESNYGGNGATFFNIRGFSTSNGLRDGFRNYGYIASRDVQNIERVEVLKGPAGAIYGGLGAIGGQINTVSKRPQAKTFGEVSVMAGRFGQVRPTFDVNVGEERGLAMRVNGSYEQNDGFRDNAGFDSYSIAPAFSWRGEDDTLTLLTEFNRLDRDGFDFGVPNLPDYRHFSRTRYYGLTGDEFSDIGGDYGKNKTEAATAIYDHRIDDDWSLRVAAQYTHATQLSQQTFPDNYAYAGGSELEFTTYIDADEWSRDSAVQVELHGQFDALGFTHQVLVGVERSSVKHGYANSSTAVFNLDLYDPNFITSHTPIDEAQGNNEGRGIDSGIYVQELLELTPTVKLLAGLRFDHFENEAVASDSKDEGSQSALSSQIGATWDVATDTTLFAHWGRSHAPNITHGISASVYDAEVGTQLEAGIKHELLAKRLFGTLAVYDLTRSNILMSDPNDPQNQVLQGRQRSKGVELDFSGEIVDGWTWIATYAHTHAVVERDSSVPEGDELSNVPRQSASLWSNYEFQGAWRGFGVGGGVYAVGSREANLPNTYRLPGYARVDGQVYYDAKVWRAQLNLTNLLNKEYYTGGDAGVFNYTLDPSPPRNVQLTLTYRL